MSEAVAAAADADPVTIVIRRRVRPGHEADYEDWLRRMQAEARTLRGYLGATVQRPGPASAREYTTVIRFAGLDALRAFESSEMRSRYLAEVVPHVEADAAWQRLTGLEFWFSPPPGTVLPQPSPWRMAALLIGVVYGLVLVIGQAVGWLLDGWPYPARLLVTIVIEVLLMTFWLMPRLTRWLAPWIYPSRRVA